MSPCLNRSDFCSPACRCMSGSWFSFQSGFCSGNRKRTNLHLMLPLEYAAMLKQVSLLLNCVSGHVRILFLISKRFLFRQQKENQPSPYLTPRVHLMSPLEYAAMLKQVRLLHTCVWGHIRILIIISKWFLFRQQKENQPSPSCRPSSMPPYSDRSVFCSPVYWSLSGSWFSFQRGFFCSGNRKRKILIFLLFAT